MSKYQITNHMRINITEIGVLAEFSHYDTQ